MPYHNTNFETSAEWLWRATWHDYPLTPESPIYPTVSTHPRPTELRIDLHEGIEVGVVLRGRQERHYPGWTVDLTPGDVWLQPMWEPHGWRAMTADTETVVLVFLPNFLGEEKLNGASWLSPFAAPPRQRPWIGDQQMRRHALSVGRDMAEEISRKEAGWLTALRLGTLQLLFRLCRTWRPPTESVDTSRATTTGLSRIMPAIARVQQRRPGSVSVAEAAAICGLSRSRFSTIFKETMGASFGQFSLRARVGYAAHCLLTSDLPIEAIAQRAGFVDASHFHRYFVKFYGRTPRVYRARTE
ncbi:MAG: helix-turn-helix domain-containing protein [Armatimonadetes bacterium]|nr:helix-turn-helix domain-containing protein [Armatimonadota bacterium]